jgi:HSP20 family molecular chaperone IbpA
MRTNLPSLIRIAHPDSDESPGSFRLEYIRIEHGSRPLPWGEQAQWIPAVDVYGNEECVILEIHLPGVQPEETQLEFGSSWVRVMGQRRHIDIPGRREFYHVEIARGDFQRLINLPEGVNTKDFETSYDLGILKITLPWQGKAWTVACRTSRFPEEWS